MIHFFNWILQLFCYYISYGFGYISNMYIHIYIIMLGYISYTYIISKDMYICIHILCLYIFILSLYVPPFSPGNAPRNLFRKLFPQSPVSELHQLLMAVSNGDWIKLGRLKPKPVDG